MTREWQVHPLLGHLSGSTLEAGEPASEWCRIYVWIYDPCHPMASRGIPWLGTAIPYNALHPDVRVSKLPYLILKCRVGDSLNACPSLHCVSLLHVFLRYSSWGLEQIQPLLASIVVDFCRKSGQLSPFLIPLSRRRRRVRSSSMVLLGGQVTSSSIV